MQGKKFPGNMPIDELVQHGANVNIHTYMHLRMYILNTFLGWA